jgi:hypothetical protein
VVYAVKFFSFENAGTPDTPVCDVPHKCILLDTNLERFLTSTSASTLKRQTVIGKDSVLDKVSNDMIAHLHEASQWKKSLRTLYKTAIL